MIDNPGISAEVRGKAIAPLDHLWFKPDQPPIVLPVGRLNVQKGCGKLLQAFKNVKEQRSARLLNLGDGEEQQTLEKLIVELELTDDVSLPGFVDNPYAYMSNATVDVLPSRWEELPTVLVEALYCDIPLVPTDCLSGSQEILQGGKFGCIVPMQDPDALAASIVGAFAGTTPRAETDSWRRFEFESIVGQNIDLLLTDKRN